MGHNVSREEAEEDKNQKPAKINKKAITEAYLDDHPAYLSEYILRNITLLDTFVDKRVTREKVEEWLVKKVPRTVCPPVEPPVEPEPTILVCPPVGPPVEPEPTILVCPPVEPPVEPEPTILICPPVGPVAPRTYLKYLSCDYMKKANMTAQHTDVYDHKDLIVRRAGTFQLGLNFKNRLYDVISDEITLEFSIGDSPSELAGTKRRCRLTSGDVTADKKRLSCVVTSKDEANNSMVVTVYVPCDVIVGKYRVALRIVSGKADNDGLVDKTYLYIMPDVIVIFNPFSVDDEVYMGDEEERNEYVMSDQGLLWAGNTRRQSKFNWSFGQFDAGILDIVFRLLNEHSGAKTNAARSMRKRKSAVHCSRVLSAMVNINDDNGVIYGRWDGDYKDGKSPGSWNGSAKILKQWNKTNEGVKYGQCWVFAGVLNTVCRALGIPARPVTNFNSAHDTEYNMSIDKFYYEDGTESTKNRSGDSIWNFHVWNDVWMRRSDLGNTDYDGWQSIDATPQEPSSNIYQCGPAPLKAIKDGEVNIGYDTAFLFGEVNADMCSFLVDKNERIIKKIGQKTRHVGRLMSTKKPGSRARLDVTDQYKYKEGTKEERVAFARAQLRGKLPHWHNDIMKQPEGDVIIDISTNDRRARTGQSVSFVVKVANKSTSTKKCKITTRIESMLYSGKRFAGIKQNINEVIIPANGDEKMTITADFDEYGSLLSDDLLLRCIASVRMASSDELYIDEDLITLKHPRMVQLVNPSGRLVKGERFELKYKITNPFTIKMKNIQMTVEGSGIDGTFKLGDAIEVGKSIEGSVHVLAGRRGNGLLVAVNVHSNEVTNIKRKTYITIH